MAFLFEISGKVAFPNPETVLIPPFKEIWERDKRKDKAYALEDFAYIEFMSSMRKSNPYRQYKGKRKEEVIIKDVITRSKWKPDDLIYQAIAKIEKFQTEASTTYSYYMAAKKAVEKMEQFFLTVDITERNEKGALLYKPRDITAAVNDTQKLLANLKALEKKVEEELYEETKRRSDKVISPFANPERLIESEILKADLNRIVNGFNTLGI